MLVLVYQWLFRQLSAHPIWMHGEARHQDILPVMQDDRSIISFVRGLMNADALFASEPDERLVSTTPANKCSCS
jgi:hypothetical protein